jgi:DNA-binding MarR family transcriptional regulator
LSHSGDQQLRELADLIGIEISNLSKITRAMEKKGLISRRRSQSDGRALSLHLTASGWKLVDILVPEALANEKGILADLDKNATEKFKRTLHIILNNLKIMLDKREGCARSKAKPSVGRR